MTGLDRLAAVERAARLQREALDTLGESLARKAGSEGSLTSIALNSIQVQAFDVARWLAESAAIRALLTHATRNEASGFDQQLAVLFSAQSINRMAAQIAFSHNHFGQTSQTALESFVAEGSMLAACARPDDWTQFGREVIERNRDLSGSPGLDDLHAGLREIFERFSDAVIAPIAERIHREDRIVPDNVLRQLAELGVFGISIPEEYGGSFSDHLAMVIATEELSRGSLGAGGSVLTRPEICAKAILAGGTEDQKRRWLPGIASGEKMVCIAVTEPNTGSDVARVSLSAKRTTGGYVLNGEKTWATFAGRSEIICLLARTGAPESGHRGLSLFIIEKPYDPEVGNEHHFRHEQPGGGLIEGRSIPTIGYRGMHSFSISFENYVVPEENLIGQEGRGFYLQMEGFAGGRIQTAARAVGVMEAALRSAVSYAVSRKLFGQRLADFGLTQFKIGQMAAKVQANRQLTYHVATLRDQGEGSSEASLVKLLACRDAEWVTREAMQLHGGMGYSEEYAVSRYALDARVLSIFEGAEEVLALQVVARPFLEKFLQPLAT